MRGPQCSRVLQMNTDWMLHQVKQNVGQGSDGQNLFAKPRGQPLTGHPAADATLSQAHASLPAAPKEGRHHQVTSAAAGPVPTESRASGHVSCSHGTRMQSGHAIEAGRHLGSGQAPGQRAGTRQRAGKQAPMMRMQAEAGGAGGPGRQPLPPPCCHGSTCTRGKCRPSPGGGLAAPEQAVARELLIADHEARVGLALPSIGPARASWQLVFAPCASARKQAGVRFKPPQGWLQGAQPQACAAGTPTCTTQVAAPQRKGSGLCGQQAGLTVQGGAPGGAGGGGGTWTTCCTCRGISPCCICTHR